jgi:uncharacterized membrane protein YGL010W
MRPIDRLFGEYADFHRDFRNQLTHYAGIPLIVLAVVGFFARIPWHGGIALTALACAWYLWLDLRLGASFALVLAGLYEVGSVVPVTALVAAFIVGWAFQLWGHHAFEKKAPAFMRSLEHLLIGPYWIFAGLLLGKKPTSD